MPPCTGRSSILGAAGVTPARITSIVGILNGGLLLGGEARLLEAVKFDVATGSYMLTLALIMPFAAFTFVTLRRWLGFALALGVLLLAAAGAATWAAAVPLAWRAAHAQHAAAQQYADSGVQR